MRREIERRESEQEMVVHDHLLQILDVEEGTRWFIDITCLSCHANDEWMDCIASVFLNQICRQT